MTLELAAFVERQLDPEKREAVKTHLADCGHCVRQVGLLSRLRESEPEEQVSEFVLARARRLVSKPDPVRTRHLQSWAAAAVIVLAVLSVFTWNEWTGRDADAPATYSEDARQVRSISSDAYAPKILSPSIDSIVIPGELQIRWTQSSETLYYQVRIVTDEGGLVWQERVEGRGEIEPGPIGLQAGGDYFVRVDAYLANTRKLSSQHIPFSVGSGSLD